MLRRIWAMVVHTIRDGLRRKVWYPFAFVATLFGVIDLLNGFDYQLKPNPYADGIIVNFFMLWTIGTLLAALYLGATSMPSERKVRTLFTLPIARWEMVLGQLVGIQTIVALFEVVGYLINIRLAPHAHIPYATYSYLFLVNTIADTFALLCLSIPLGAWLSPAVAGTLTLVTPVASWFYAAYDYGRRFPNGLPPGYVSAPVPPPPRGTWVLIQNSYLHFNVLHAALIFIALTLLLRRKELSMK